MAAALAIDARIERWRSAGAALNPPADEAALERRARHDPLRSGA